MWPTSHHHKSNHFKPTEQIFALLDIKTENNKRIILKKRRIFNWKTHHSAQISINYHIYNYLISMILCIFQSVTHFRVVYINCLNLQNCRLWETHYFNLYIWWSLRGCYNKTKKKLQKIFFFEKNSASTNQLLKIHQETFFLQIVQRFSTALICFVCILNYIFNLIDIHLFLRFP